MPDTTAGLDPRQPNPFLHNANSGNANLPFQNSNPLLQWQQHSSDQNANGGGGYNAGATTPPPAAGPLSPTGVTPGSARSGGGSAGAALPKTWDDPCTPEFEAAIGQIVRTRVWKYRQKDHWLYLSEAEALSLHSRLTKTVVRDLVGIRHV
jgi:hypothetical protein